MSCIIMINVLSIKSPKTKTKSQTEKKKNKINEKKKSCDYIKQ